MKRIEQYCARPDCRAFFLVPDDRKPNKSGAIPIYCCLRCKQITNGRIQRAAWSELARRHHGEFLAIRAAERERQHAMLPI